MGTSIDVDCFRLALDDSLRTLIAHRVALQTLLRLLISLSRLMTVEDLVDS